MVRATGNRAQRDRQPARDAPARLLGWNQRLFGDHDIRGPEGVRFYLRYQAVMQRWPTGARRGPEFAVPTLGQ